jgi:hypothetical protein
MAYSDIDQKQKNLNKNFSQNISPENLSFDIFSGTI